MEFFTKNKYPIFLGFLVIAISFGVSLAISHQYNSTITQTAYTKHGRQIASDKSEDEKKGSAGKALFSSGIICGASDISFDDAREKLRNITRNYTIDAKNYNYSFLLSAPVFQEDTGNAAGKRYKVCVSVSIKEKCHHKRSVLKKDGQSKPFDEGHRKHKEYKDR